MVIDGKNILWEKFLGKERERAQGREREMREERERDEREWD